LEAKAQETALRKICRSWMRMLALMVQEWGKQVEIRNKELSLLLPQLREVEGRKAAQGGRSGRGAEI
jgi:hypothetical protein